jgi:hypothetical protein
MLWRLREGTANGVRDHHRMDKTQYTGPVTVVMLSAFVPTPDGLGRLAHSYGLGGQEHAGGSGGVLPRTRRRRHQITAYPQVSGALAHTRREGSGRPSSGTRSHSVSGRVPLGCANAGCWHRYASRRSPDAPAPFLLRGDRAAPCLRGGRPAPGALRGHRPAVPAARQGDHWHLRGPDRGVRVAAQPGELVGVPLRVQRCARLACAGSGSTIAGRR